MHFYTNHMWCSESNWDGKPFLTRYMISIDKYDGRSLFPKYTVVDEDWGRLLYFKDVWLQGEYDKWISYYNSDGYRGRFTANDKQLMAKVSATKYDVPFLKQEVIDWLNENVADDPKPHVDQVANGWCMGNDSYRASGSDVGFALFFYRRCDAMAFVKRWSVHGKCTTYFDYFKEIRKELIDGKLVRVEY